MLFVNAYPTFVYYLLQLQLNQPNKDIKPKKAYLFVTGWKFILILKILDLQLKQEHPAVWVGTHSHKHVRDAKAKITQKCGDCQLGSGFLFRGRYLWWCQPICGRGLKSRSWELCNWSMISHMLWTVTSTCYSYKQHSKCQRVLRVCNSFPHPSGGYRWELTAFVIGVFLQLLGLPFVAVSQVSLFSKVTAEKTQGWLTSRWHRSPYSPCSNNSLLLSICCLKYNVNYPVTILCWQTKQITQYAL